MQLSRILTFGLGIIINSFLISCEDFLEVDAPDYKIVSETVFNDDETALSAMAGIYNKLFMSSFSDGWENSVTVLAGLAADDLQAIRENDLTLLEFDQNDILPANTRNLSLWSSAYGIIYMTNSLIEGSLSSNGLSESVQATLIGEAKFIRAFTYFYLVNLYGEIPLILTSDYIDNSLASQVNESMVYEQIVLDLKDAIKLLGEDYREDDRTRVNKYVATSLLSRVYLYLENWEEAERFSSEVINSSHYELLDDLDGVFLANSREAIWQISPIGGGGVFTSTNEGFTFIIDPYFFSHTKVGLGDDLVESYFQDDKRLLHWIGYNEPLDTYFAYKYKDADSMENITEYSMVMRLAEQYLIRAEARARQNNLSGANQDLERVQTRYRTSLPDDIDSSFNQEQLLDDILEERKKEFFTEWGHRWFDLKRTGKTAEVLGTDKILFPIPEEELLKNPNLNQNSHY